MKRDPFLIFAFLAVLFLSFSCGGNPFADGEAKRELARLDSLVEADADSALRLMGRMQSEDWSQRDAMRLELLRAKAMNRADSLFTTDSLMLRVAEYYQRHGSRNDRMLSLYLLGCTYRDMGAAPRAIETWQQAVAEADTTAGDCDLSTLMRIHSQMNVLYTRQRLPGYAQQELEKAEALCWKMKDTLNGLIFEEKKCGILFNYRKYEECIQASNALSQYCFRHGYRDNGAIFCVFCVKSYLALEDYAKAKEYLDIYGSYCLALTDHRKIDGGLAPYYIYKGRYYLGIGNLDSAEYCFRKAMPEMMALDNDVAVYKGLQNVYNARHQADSVLKYSALYGQAKERSYASDIAQATINTKSLYDYSVEQRIAKEEREKAEKRKYMLINTCWIIALVIGVILFRYQRKKKKIKELREELSEKNEALTLAENRFQELKSQDISNSPEIKDKERTIIQLKRDITYLKLSLSRMNGEKTEESLENSKIIRRFMRSASDAKEPPISSEDWESLSRLIDEYYPTFRLLIVEKHNLPFLHERLCMLTLAGLNPTQISNLLEMSQSYSSTVRKRLYKKIFNADGKPSDFDNKIRSMF